MASTAARLGKKLEMGWEKKFAIENATKHAMICATKCGTKCATMLDGTNAIATVLDARMLYAMNDW
jgi:hypothetical protein